MVGEEGLAGRAQASMLVDKLARARSAFTSNPPKPFFVWKQTYCEASRADTLLTFTHCCIACSVKPSCAAKARKLLNAPSSVHSVPQVLLHLDTP